MISNIFCWVFGGFGMILVVVLTLLSCLPRQGWLAARPGSCFPAPWASMGRNRGLSHSCDLQGSPTGAPVAQTNRTIHTASVFS